MLAVSAFAASPEAPAPRHMTAVVRADVKTGRLVRSVVLVPRVIAAQAAAPALRNAAPERTESAQAETASVVSLHDLIDQIASEQGVESHLVHSVIRAESNYNPVAVSPKGAQGIMQLIPSTARRFGVANTFDAGENIRGGVRYLRFLLDYYQGDYPKTIAAYNAGEAAVDKYNGIPPYAETQNYVYQVAKNLKASRQTAAKSLMVVARQNPVDPETPKPIQTSTGSDGRVYYHTP
jgi:soluble lytic murein transglycosylase-like protein